MSNKPNPDPQMIDDERAYSYRERNIVVYGGELKPFTLKQSLEWAKRNCTPETVKRLRSRAVVARLVEEVEKLQVLLGEAFSEFNSCGDQSVQCFIEHTHYCGRCDSSIDRNAVIRNKIYEHLVTKP